jgi:hypothetical protein
MSPRDAIAQAIMAAARRAGGRAPLENLPVKPVTVEGAPFVPGPFGKAHDVAERYMQGAGLKYTPETVYKPVDVEKATAAAKAFDQLPMYDPQAIASYEAMIAETLKQYDAIKKSGLKIIPTTAETYPYVGNPRAVAKDVADRNRMSFFLTEGGFGTPSAGSGIALEHPMLRQSGVVEAGAPLTNNDLFRVVHDYFGHIKPGVGFRAAGEDNAWRSHASMYSPAARPAMTAETRGQNSWVNFGPHGEFNRTASGADTIYSPQKVGLLPDWVMKYVLPGGVMGATAAQDEYGSRP